MLIYCYQLLSESYLFMGWLVLLMLLVIKSLNIFTHFPNIYFPLLYITCLFFYNSIFIDLANLTFFIKLISYELIKHNGDIIFKNFILIISICFFIYSYFSLLKLKNVKVEYIIFIYLSIFSFTLFILSNDTLSFYLLLELQSLSFYILTAFSKNNQYSVESALKYFILSSFSSVFFLYGFSILYGLGGILNFYDIYLFFSNGFDHLNIILFLTSIFIFIPFLFKLYIAPFHFWIADIYQGANFPTTAFFATISTLPLYYIITKFYISYFHYIQPYFSKLFLIFSISSMIFGVIGTIYQKKIRRLLAFSSVTNTGYLLLMFMHENPIMITNVFTYFIFYIVNSTGIFIIFLNIYDKYYKNFIERLFSLRNVFKNHKNDFFLFIMVVFIFSAAGIPPFSLFFAKILILTGLSQYNYLLIMFIMVIVTIISSFYYLRIIKTTSFHLVEKQMNIVNYHFIDNINFIAGILMSIFFFFNIIGSLMINEISIFLDYSIIHIVI